MIFTETAVPGVWMVEPELLTDERGHFARVFDADEYASRDMEAAVVQCSTSFNRRIGTLRGLHYQAEPHGEAKLVRCTRGAIYDVAVDLRPDSPAYLSWSGAELTEDNGCTLFIPRGCAHGFQTLRDDSEIYYQISAAYEPSAARGVRWNDPAFDIRWPDAPPGGRTIADRDATYPDLRP